MEGGDSVSWTYVLTLVTTIGGYVWAFLLIPRIVMSRKEPGPTLAWILAIAFLPWVGAGLFFLVGRRRIRRRTRRRAQHHETFRRELDGLPHGARSCDDPERCRELPAPADEIADVAARVADSPLLSDNLVQCHTDTNRVYRLMEEAIEGAQHHVHLQSYIYRADRAGTRFRDLLIERARAGVRIRLLVDAVGSHQIPGSFVRPLTEAGGKFARFMPVLRFRPRWRPNLRNHRKILVVDGRIGFAGGMNIGDEYQGRKKRYAPWRDTHVRIAGPAVLRLQEIFAEDWHFETGEDLVDPAYFPRCPPAGDDLVQVIESGPDMPHENIYAVVFTAVTRARKRIQITTPYFVPGAALLTALKGAAWRGVDVRILLPGRVDLKLVQAAGRSYHEELLEAGVRLYEHGHGMLHAKTLVVDGIWSSVGSANMDIRSFRLNFESNVLVTGQDFAEQLETIFERDVARARELTLEMMAQKPHYRRLVEGLARVLSPVL